MNENGLEVNKSEIEVCNSHDSEDLIAERATIDTAKGSSGLKIIDESVVYARMGRISAFGPSLDGSFYE